MWRFVMLLAATPAWADSVIATRPIAMDAIITAEDITLVSMDIPGALRHTKDAIGQTSATEIAAGHAVRSDQLLQRVQVQRNAVVEIYLTLGGMEIRTEGRALSDGSQGEMIDVMNLSSRARVRGTIESSGIVRVNTTQPSE